jgi:hypothetical protein
MTQIIFRHEFQRFYYAAILKTGWKRHSICAMMSNDAYHP